MIFQELRDDGTLAVFSFRAGAKAGKPFLRYGDPWRLRKAARPPAHYNGGKT